MDMEGIGRVATNTTLAACAGTLIAVAWVYPRSKKWDVGMSINGLLAGLVAITCPCYWVSPTGALAIGAVAGAICVLAVDLTEWLRVDDPCGAFAVHGACGIWGTLSLGLFAVGNYDAGSGLVKGLFYGGGGKVLLAQVIGSATFVVALFAVGLLLMFGLKAMGVLRLPEAAELEGLDIAEHGAPAYHPEYAYMGYSPIPSNLEGVAPGLTASAAPPSDIRLPSAD
jgi:Amt family ammonium transporter